MSENSSAAEAAPTPVETVIIGAGPVGLFQIFELGLLGINAHIIDSLAQAGGQCTELYPDKPIYDIPALPICGAQELIDRLLEQAKPFHATFHLGQEVTELQPLEGGKFHVATSTGTRLIAGAVVIAAGVGSFQPRRLALPGRSIHNRTTSPAATRAAASDSVISRSLTNTLPRSSAAAAFGRDPARSGEARYLSSRSPTSSLPTVHSGISHDTCVQSAHASST